MKLKHYDYQPAENFCEYSFYSDGPTGRIKKSVVYTRIQDSPTVYNLAFGDVDSATDEINDKVKSNNGDMDTVLSTVANTINDFSDNYGNHLIFASGSTMARTRLYQMAVSGIWDEIRKDFDLWGYKNDDWQEFRRNINYQAFLVKRK